MEALDYNAEACQYPAGAESSEAAIASPHQSRAHHLDQSDCWPSARKPLVPLSVFDMPTVKVLILLFLGAKTADQG